MTFTLLHSFDGTDGQSPYAGLVQGTDDNFYGTTELGGADDNGTVFKITPSGILTTLHSLNSLPAAGLVQAIDGNFYGTTLYGGTVGDGTVFRITPEGALTTLYNFCSQGGGDCTDGREPVGGLVQGIDGNFYGTTLLGGANSCAGAGCGTVFRITLGGTLTTLHSFDGTDGEYPYAGLVQGTDGNFYGTTQSGGAHGYGTAFKTTPGATLTTLHSFDGTDGECPYAGLVQGTDGNFYGTTQSGGAHGYGTVFNIRPTPPYTLTTFYNFCSQGGSNCTDGRGPNGLIQATDGRLYGTTQFGGANSCHAEGCGTVFGITPGGTLTTLHSFDYTDGYYSTAGLVQDTNGKFYGTASSGGAHEVGTVFSLSVGIGPFVKTLPAFGKMGTPVHLLGTNLTGTTSVTFNEKPATFTVVSKTLIFTNVPAGATTGTVQVVTPSGTLSSNVPFTVN